MEVDPENVVNQYFSGMRAGDKSVVDLFDEDATLIGLGKTQSGKAAIREFYHGVIGRAGRSGQSPHHCWRNRRSEHRLSSRRPG